MTKELSPAKDISTRVLQPLLNYVHDTYGKEALEKVALASGFRVSEVHRTAQWISIAGFEKVLTGARALMADDREFLKASKYRFRESLGPITYLLQAASLRTALVLATKTFGIVCRAGRLEVKSSSGNALVLSYSPMAPESRPSCLSRQAAFASSTPFGYPPVALEESACIAKGDPACLYRLTWTEAARWPMAIPWVVGATVVAGSLCAAGFVDPMSAVALAALGGSLGWGAILRRTLLAHQAASEEVHRGLRHLADESNQAHEEVLALTRRQEDWSRLLEEQVADRTSAMQSLVDHLRGMREDVTATIRHASHDLRNPLTVLRLNQSFLVKNERGHLSPDGVESLQTMGECLTRMDAMLARLVDDSAAKNDTTGRLCMKIDVPGLAERLRRRLNALVHSRTVRVSVVTCRDAPLFIEGDPVLFDRVVDNLLTNAAKYTDSGGITLEICGIPQMLCLKISDTGVGISPDRIEAVFHGATGPDARTLESHGVGLSSAVRVLARMGGRLEVMSTPNIGTTFWAYFPLRPATARFQDQSETPREIIDRVVTIRRAAS